MKGYEVLMCLVGIIRLPFVYDFLLFFEARKS
jgi:hypothetical protein